MAGTRAPYGETDIRDLAGIARGRRNKHVVDEELLGKRLNEWLRTYDLVDLSQLPDSEDKEYQTVWRELTEREPSHAEMTQILRKIIDLSGQLSEVLNYSSLPPGINAGARRVIADVKARHKTSSQIRRTIEDGIFVKDFRDRLELLRQVCTGLENFHASRTPRNRPTKDKLSHLLYELAVIFIDVTGQDCAVHDLPHSNNTKFTGWASAVLEPFYHGTETSRSALASRFRRDISEYLSMTHKPS